MRSTTIQFDIKNLSDQERSLGRDDDSKDVFMISLLKWVNLFPSRIIHSHILRLKAHMLVL